MSVRHILPIIVVFNVGDVIHCYILHLDENDEELFQFTRQAQRNGHVSPQSNAFTAQE
jgi:hypothetical protein